MIVAFLVGLHSLLYSSLQLTELLFPQSPMQIFDLKNIRIEYIPNKASLLEACVFPLAQRLNCYSFVNTVASYDLSFPSRRPCTHRTCRRNRLTLCPKPKIFQ
jgi:hypothetical protein